MRQNSSKQKTSAKGQNPSAPWWERVLDLPAGINPAFEEHPSKPRRHRDSEHATIEQLHLPRAISCNSQPEVA